MWVTTAGRTRSSRITPDGTADCSSGAHPDSIRDHRRSRRQSLGRPGDEAHRDRPREPARRRDSDRRRSTRRAQGITTGPDGNIWIVGTNRLIEIDPANPAGAAASRRGAHRDPKGMTTGSDGLLWIADGRRRSSARRHAAAPPCMTTTRSAAGPGRGRRPQRAGRLRKPGRQPAERRPDHAGGGPAARSRSRTPTRSASPSATTAPTGSRDPRPTICCA